MAQVKTGITGGKGANGNLNPAKPGEVRNKTGVNGVTKKRVELAHELDRIMGSPIAGKGSESFNAQTLKAMATFIVNGWSRVAHSSAKPKTPKEALAAMSDSLSKGEAALLSFATGFLYERWQGKVTQPLTGEDGGPLQFQTVVQFVGCGVKAGE
jgi:hypothetical protein